MPDYLSSKYSWKGTLHILTEVKRQEDGSYILKTATNIRKAIDENKQSIDIESFKFNSIYSAANQYVADYKTNKEDHSISIGCTHNSNKLFNDLVRERLFGRSAGPVVKGDLMLVIQSWSRDNQKLYNGDHVTIEEVHLDKVETVGGLHFAPVKLKSKSLAGEEMIIEDYLLLDSIFFPAGISLQKKKRC